MACLQTQPRRAKIHHLTMVKKLERIVEVFLQNYKCVQKLGLSEYCKQKIMNIDADLFKL